MALFYSIVLLRGLGILLPDDVDVMSRLSEQVAVIKDSDVFPEREDQVLDVIDKLIHQTCDMWFWFKIVVIVDDVLVNVKCEIMLF